MADWGLRNDKLRQGKAAVSQALQFLNSQDIAEEADPYFRHVRVLAFALHGMMMASAAGGPKLVTAVTTSEGMPRKVRGKHVIVSLGPRGALWCGPKEVVTRPRPGQARDAAARSQATADTVVLDDFTATRVFAAAVPRNVVNASGAGDTMCAGIIAAMLSGACHELDGVCVEAGKLIFIILFDEFTMWCKMVQDCGPRARVWNRPTQSQATQLRMCYDALLRSWMTVRFCNWFKSNMPH